MASVWKSSASFLFPKPSLWSSLLGEMAEDRDGGWVLALWAEHFHDQAHWSLGWSQWSVLQARPSDAAQL